jgi:hypothetical protein
MIKTLRARLLSATLAGCDVELVRESTRQQESK